MSALDIRTALAIPGWMTRTELAWLAAQAGAAQVVVEVGCYQGRSTRALADHCPGVVYAIDPWDGPCLRENGTTAPNDWAVWDAFTANLRAHIDSGRVVPMRTSASTALATLFQGHVAADLVFIDGDHRQMAVTADLEAAWPLVRSGGILAGHDYKNLTWPGVTQAVIARFGQAVQSVDMLWWVRKP